MGNRHEKLSGLDRESEFPPNSLQRLLSLRSEADILTELMLHETHIIVRAAFQWKADQNLRWIREWKPEVGSKKKEPIRYYYLTEEGDQTLLLEVFEPVFINPYDKSIVKPTHLCIVEYRVPSENPLAFTDVDIVGSTAMGQNTSNKYLSEDMKDFFFKEAADLAVYEGKPIHTDERLGGFYFGNNCNSFGYQTKWMNNDYRTNIPTEVITPFSRLSDNLDIRSGNALRTDIDPIETARRRLNMLSRAKLIGMNDPLHGQIEPIPEG